MYKKSVTYVDFNDVERTEDFYFNFTKAELTDMNLTVEGGLEQLLKKIVDFKDIPSLIRFFKELVLKSYGEKSPDGRRFMKTPEITESFSQTQAYSDIYMEFVTDTDSAIEFVKKIMPKDIAEEMEKAELSNK